MQHMVKEANPSTDGDLLRGRELRGMLGAWLGDNAIR